MGNKFTRKFKLGESKSRDSGGSCQNENKAQAEKESPKKDTPVNEIGASPGASPSVEETANSHPAEGAQEVARNVQQVTIKIDEVGPNDPDADPPNLISQVKPEATASTTEPSKPETKTSASEQSKPETATSTSEPSKPETTTSASEPSKPETTTATSELSGSTKDEVSN